MSAPKITLRVDSSALVSALQEFGEALALPALELDVDDGFGQFRNLIRKLFVQSVFDFSNLVCIRTDSPTGIAGDVLVSFYPSELFLELLATLRTGDGEHV